MTELSGLQIFKYLPAAKKLSEGNCKKCGLPTCMAFALKLAKGQAQISLCPYVSKDLKEMFELGMKKPQKEILLGHKNKVLVGGENVLYRHDKTFVNKTAVAVVIDTKEKDWQNKLQRVLDFEITRVNETFKVDLIYLKGKYPPPQSSPSRGGEDMSFSKLTDKLDDLGFAWIVEEDLKDLIKVEDKGVFETVEKLTKIRKKAVLEKDDKYSTPVYVYFPSPLGGEGGQSPGEGLLELMSKASFYLCKYANMLIFEDFDEALFSTLMTLRQNIFTDPQKPLQVESKVYEFNNPDKNALIFLTTNFALTYFAIANEIEALNKPAYLVVTPSEGMSVLTAWSAEKFTAQMVAKTVAKYELAKKVKNKKIIIPGLLAHMAQELREELKGFEIIVGPNEAYLLADFVKSIN
ncbi:MAG TPA: (Fe-S)-binding protein [Candidatus Gastranaerophilaceae bacterium]|nr:(Fe-S)-binding protein [Candidatus Gastranaerophilaceae bacterium]HPT41927.1 (Fe-S)-binding protein [Candidatus Gastranaerophilaceae bacterium]